MTRITISQLYKLIERLHERPFNYAEYHEVADLLAKHGMKTKALELRKEAARKAKDGD